MPPTVHGLLDQPGVSVQCQDFLQPPSLRCVVGVLVLALREVRALCVGFVEAPLDLQQCDRDIPFSAAVLMANTRSTGFGHDSRVSSRGDKTVVPSGWTCRTDRYLTRLPTRHVTDWGRTLFRCICRRCRCARAFLRRLSACADLNASMLPRVLQQARWSGHEEVANEAEISRPSSVSWITSAMSVACASPRAGWYAPVGCVCEARGAVLEMITRRQGAGLQ